MSPGWRFFKKKVLQAPEQPIPSHQKMSQKGRAAWQNRELWLQLGKQEENLQTLEEAADNLGGLQGCHEIIQGEN